MPIPTVSIVIPTFRRPNELRRSLHSCIVQKSAWPMEIVVVDNDRAPSARGLVVRMSNSAPVAVRYVHEPAPGIAAARNTGADAAKGNWVAFVDDDNILAGDWLVQMIRALEEGHFDAVFGAIDAVFESKKPRHWKALHVSLSRQLAIPEGQIPRSSIPRLGAGCSIFRRADLCRLRFDDQFGLSGGEDSDLIQKLCNTGAKMGWAPTAHATEIIPESRCELKFLLKRRFGAGQIRTCLEARQNDVGSTKQAALWMALGAGQVGVATARVGVAAVRGTDAGAPLADVAAGLGKILWWKRLQRYGGDR